MRSARRMRLWKYLLLAVAAVLVVGFAVVPRPAPPPTYTRYISSPLPDGVRYTFLCPSTLDDVSLYTFPANYRGKYLQSLSVSKKESRLPGVSLWHRWFRPETEFVFVSVEKPAVRPLRSSRVDRQGVRNRDEIAHRVYVDDPRAREHFMFGHVDDFGTVSYTQDDPVVTNSFRILLPGEPVPMP